MSAQPVFRVPDCHAAYDVLRGRGAEFLIPPVENGYETRALFRDPDGHLFEITALAARPTTRRGS